MRALESINQDMRSNMNKTRGIHGNAQARSAPCVLDLHVCGNV